MEVFRAVIAMKKTKFKKSQIVFALEQAETGLKAAEVCRNIGLRNMTPYSVHGKPRIEIIRVLNQHAESTSLCLLSANTGKLKFELSTCDVAIEISFLRPDFEV